MNEVGRFYMTKGFKKWAKKSLKEIDWVQKMISIKEATNIIIESEEQKSYIGSLFDRYKNYLDEKRNLLITILTISGLIIGILQLIIK